MSASVWGGVVLGTVMLGNQAAVAPAQEGKGTADKPAATKPAEKPSDKPAAAGEGQKVDPVKEFEQVSGQLQKFVGALRQIEGEARLAKPDERLTYLKKYQDTLREAQALYPKLLPAAERAFAVDPDEKKDHTQHLLGVASEEVRGGDFKTAVRVLKLLIDGKLDNAQIRSMAAMAAFCTGDEAATKEHLAKAVVDGKPTPDAEKITVELQARAADAKANDLPRVKLETTKGDIVIELFENEAPNTVANFITLVEKEFYNKLAFHRVIEGFMAQGGDPKGDGSGGPGYAVPCECYVKGHRNHFFGTLSMAHAGKDTGGSQFFLTFGPTAHLDGKHTAFGRVIEGGDVLAKLTRIEPGQPGEPDRIVKATVVRKRQHEYKAKTLPDPRPAGK